jgi:hypothetical protein
MLSSPVCDEPDVYYRPLHPSCISLPPAHPFTTTHCLEFIKTSLIHACLVWFLSGHDVVLSFFPSDHPFKINRDIKYDGRRALLLLAIQE